MANVSLGANAVTPQMQNAGVWDWEAAVSSIASVQLASATG